MSNLPLVYTLLLLKPCYFPFNVFGLLLHSLFISIMYSAIWSIGFLIFMLRLYLFVKGLCALGEIALKIIIIYIIYNHIICIHIYIIHYIYS